MTLTNQKVQQVADLVIKRMEDVGTDWLKPFGGHTKQGDYSLPHNLQGRNYSGINLFWLQMFNPYPCNTWATFKQINGAGGKVLKGETATPVFYYGQHITTKEGEDGKNYNEGYKFLKSYNVFNLEQTTLNAEDFKQKNNKPKSLVKKIQKKQSQIEQLENKPIFIKIAPDLDDEQLRDIALMSLANNVNGLIISNSTIQRPDTLISNFKNEVGGLSGKPIFLNSTILLKKMYSLTNGQIALIGVGGVSSGHECYEKIKAGASLVQLYTALVYKGPKIIDQILKELDELITIDGYKNISEAIGKST